MRESHSAIVQLTKTRLRQFCREPSSVFWSFGFPVLLTIALGIAFRNRPPEPVAVAVQMGEGADLAMASLAADPGIRARLLTPAEAEAALRTGRVTLVVIPGE